MTVKAAVDIHYPDEQGRPKVIYKKGDVIKDKALAERFCAHAKELVEIDESPKKSEKPVKAGKKKSKK